MDLIAIAGGRIEVVGGVRVFYGTKDDPQLLLTRGKTGTPLRLVPGSRTFTFSAKLESGEVVNPRLYFDLGDGFGEGEDQQALLEQVSDTEWSCRIENSRPIEKIRFDPSEGRVTLSWLKAELKSSDTQMETLDEPKRSLSVFTVIRGFYRRLPKPVREFLREQTMLKRIYARLFRSHFSHGGFNPEAANRPTGGDWASGLAQDYTDRTFTAKGGRNSDFGAIAAQPVDRSRSDLKVVTFYLPQMHPIPENDAWWGRGFTEWTNVSKAVAQFEGHYQPKLPGELGFYDLRVPEVMNRQVELAKLYGVHAFCFYYYWFDGHRLLERPLDMFLENNSGRLDIDFCVCWANENWTRRWDGAESEVLMAQRHGPEDHARVFDDLARYFEDTRYMRVDGKPVILIYRPTIIPDLENMLRIWRQKAAARGMLGLYIVATNAFGFDTPAEHGFDAICSFPPHGTQVPAVNQMYNLINSEYSGYIFRYQDVVDFEISRYGDPGFGEKDGSAARFPGVMVAWDNEARKPSRGNVFHGSTPRLYHDWLSAAASYTKRRNNPDAQLVFVNAWNEWAEGAYLEPDQRFGYSYLAATADVIRQDGSQKAQLEELAQAYNARRSRSSDTVICIHLFYDDLIDEFAAQLADWQGRADVILTVPDSWSVERFNYALERIAPVRIMPTANRGRDVWPFLQALRIGRQMGYRVGCKIHSKKSPQLNDGNEWRKRLTNGLLSDQAWRIISGKFIREKRYVMAAPKSEKFVVDNLLNVRDNMVLSDRIMSRLGIEKFVLDEFVAGTMFWFKFDLMKEISQTEWTEADCGPELAQIDGTFAHAFERVFVPYAKAMGGQILYYELDAGEDAASNRGN
jgi:lipopolysaccharide biosynthesis protein